MQKITKAMKMVAAARLRRAQERVVAARPYANTMMRVLGALAERAGTPALFQYIQNRIIGDGSLDGHAYILLCSHARANSQSRRTWAKLIPNASAVS